MAERKLKKFHSNFPSSFQVFIFASVLCKSFGEIIVINNETNKTVQRYLDYELDFAAPVTSHGLEGVIITADPENACKPIKNRPDTPDITWFVLIKRRGCSLEEKVRNAQHAGFHGAIIYNVAAPIPDKYAKYKQAATIGLTNDSDIIIPAVLIDEDDGLHIASDYQYNQNYKLIIKQVSNFSFNDLFLPCMVVVGACTLTLILFMVVKCIKERRRNRRNRLSSRHLKHLQIIKYKTGVYDKYDVCAVCLDQYCDGEKLRILPCSHAYHTKCIDPWLTNNRRNCPICKRKVIIEGVTPETDSESESESNETHSETTPLLNTSPTLTSSNNNYGGVGSSEEPRARQSLPQINNEEETTSQGEEYQSAWVRRQTTFQAILHNVRKAGRKLNGGGNSSQELLDNASSSSSGTSRSSSAASLLPPSDANSINFEVTVEEERDSRVNAIVEIASVASEQATLTSRSGRSDLVI